MRLRGMWYSFIISNKLNTKVFSVLLLGKVISSLRGNSQNLLAATTTITKLSTHYTYQFVFVIVNDKDASAPSSQSMSLSPHVYK